MHFVACTVSVAILFILSISTRESAAQNVPACNRQVITRHVNQITIGIEELSNVFNQDLKGAHSSFSDLQLASTGGDKLKVSGKNNGTPVEISGPLQW